ncbi:hypothetical protein RJ640_018365 [Escallonia rubra]|uniref:Uncharacterized protein n=1 Tax=Escallonia rubra TaxID=112253 RepID=A0AA88RXP9_9ASTE|nr:hypothetical protein RJ640_018365 [Escallonia rubra]
MEPEIKHVSRQGSGTETKRMSPENIAQNVVEMISEEIKEQQHKSSFKKDDPCIYKVPIKLCQEKGPAYTPRVVSIGPIHHTLRAVSTGSIHNTPHAVSTEPIHNTPHAVSIGPIQNDEQPFLEMEGIKVNYMNRLFRQTTSPKLKDDDDAHIRECACAVVAKLPGNDEQPFLEMEGIKVNYVNRLFRQTTGSKPKEDVDALILECACAVVAKLPNARSCYNEDLSEYYDDPNFAKMMLTDGAFIIELLWTSRKWYKESDDPIFGNTLKFHNVRHDLLLLENQIPFFVLQDLFNLTVKKLQTDGDPSLSDFILEFFGRQIPGRRESSKPPLHILGILHTSFMPRSKDGLGNDTSPAPDLESGTREDTDSKSRSNGCLSWLYGTTGTPLPKQPYHPIMKHSATELASAGVIFTPREAEDLDVEFNTSCWFHWFCGPRTSDIPPSCIYNNRSSYCFLSWFFLLCGKTRFAVPQLCVDDAAEPLLRNLIAFEQCYAGIPRYVTSYAFLMYTLIDDEDDVELLENAGVIQENLGARESTSKLFKDLCKEVVLADFSFLAQWKEVHNYCKSYSHTNLARARPRNKSKGRGPPRVPVPPALPKKDKFDDGEVVKIEIDESLFND